MDKSDQDKLAQDIANFKFCPEVATCGMQVGRQGSTIIVTCLKQKKIAGKNGQTFGNVQGHA